MLLALACALLGAGAFAQADVAAAAEKPIQVGVYYFGNYHLDPRNEKRLGKGWTEWKAVRDVFGAKKPAAAQPAEPRP